MIERKKVTILITGVGDTVGQGLIKAARQIVAPCRIVGIDRDEFSVGLRWVVAGVPDTGVEMIRFRFRPTGQKRRRIAAAGCRYDGRERTSEGHLSLARHHGRSRHGEGRDQRYLPVQHDHVHGERAADKVTSPYGVSSFFKRAIAARACAAAPLVG